MSGGYGSHPLINEMEKCHSFLGRLMKILYPPMPTLNTMPSDVLLRIQEKIFDKENRILNIGSGANTGCGCRLWKYSEIQNCSIIHVDIMVVPSVDISADAHCLPFADETFDAVIMQAVLEHVHDIRKAIMEAYRVLSPKGYIYIEMPFLQGVHADPHDFQRLTGDGIKQLLKDFQEIESGVSVGPFCALVWIARDGLSHLFRNKWIYAIVRFSSAWLFSPIRYIDYLIRNTRSYYRLACEYFSFYQKR